MAVGDILLSAFFQVFFDRLASRNLLDFLSQLQGGFDKELKRWERMMQMIQAVLEDAEEKQHSNKAVKMWLEDLQDLAYDAEDVLDEFAIEALENNLMAEREEGTGEVRNFITASISTALDITNAVMSNFSMGSKINDITRRLEDLFEQRTLFGLRENPAGGSSSTTPQKRLASSSVPIERAVYGRNDDKAKILQMVLRADQRDVGFRVIPIVGMGGSGKTTLAREVYNDKRVEEFKFDLKAWICVSDVFDVMSISRAVLESITSAPCHFQTLDKVQVKLKEAVQGNKFLLVLDDVWNEDYSLWRTLRAPFMAGAPNSKIIVTTRHAKVASTMGSVEYYKLLGVSDEACWSIFKMHAFEGSDLDAYEISELFREKVTEKCRGLPLAATTLGGLLRFKRDDTDAWDEILNSNLWDFSPQNDILPVLRLSYHYLPAHLKRCFGYCAIFPKDYEFDKKKLVLLWMAEGLIRQPSHDKHVEDWGNKWFDDLVSRSIFQQSSTGNSKFVMHDLVHDLAQLVSGGTILRLEEEVNKLSRRFERIRYASYIRGRNDGKNKFEVLNEVDEHLRTFLPVDIRGGTTISYITNMVLNDLLPKLKKLRVLSLDRYGIIELPNHIKDLRLLSYLNLSGTAIRCLPESTSTLLNLQILILRNCSRLIKLPSELKNLINLYHLDIKGANLLKEMPLGMRKLKCLHNLSNFIVGKDTSSTLEDLKYLKFLRRKLCISKLENVKHLWEAREAEIHKKQNLEALLLQWSSQFDNSRDEVAAENVLDMLRPRMNIKKLKITCYGGKRFPIWIGDPSFSKMEVLKLENCENCMSLPSLGLLGSLKNLIIKGMKRLNCIGSEIYGKGYSIPFQSLEILHFENLEEWEYWDTDVKENDRAEIFPLLRELSIKKCPKLSRKLPKLLPSLETLVVSKCSELAVSVSSFPMLSRLEIDECKGLQVCNPPINSELIKRAIISRSSLQINGCKGMLCNRPNQDLLESLSISNFLEFGIFLKQGFQMVDTLAVGDPSIKYMLQVNYMEGLQIINQLGEVSSLVSFPEVNLPLHNVRSIRIVKLRALKSLPEELMGNNSQLEMLDIRECDSLTFIARCKLPPSLKSLIVLSCKNLQHLVVDEEDASSSSSSSVALKKLFIINCPELTKLSSRIQLLEYLSIRDCPKLESIPNGLHNLKEIHMWNCPGGVSLLERGLPNTISAVEMGGCEKLKALPNNMHELNSLQQLYIGRLLSNASFPEDGFPSNLTCLSIDNREIYKGLIRWGLHRLTSLQTLYISECHEAESFPTEEIEMMLPTSLTYLDIELCPKLKYLITGFQHLTSLEYFHISDCPNLTSFPEGGLPSSLLELSIKGCPKLKGFPEVGLPSLLSVLYIENCPRLKEECTRGKGKEWSKISHIPCVHIDYKFIYDPEDEASA